MILFPLILPTAQVAVPGEVPSLIAHLGPIPPVARCGVGGLSRRGQTTSEAAAARLASLGSVAVGPLLQVIGTPSDWRRSDDPNRAKRSFAILILGRMRAAEAIPSIVTVLQRHPEPEECGAAIAALTNLRALAHVPDLVERLGDGRRIPWMRHITVSQMAALSLRSFGTDAIIPISRALDSSVPEKQEGAILAAGYNGSKAFAPRLGELAPRGRMKIRLDAIRTLAICGTPDSVRVLAPLLASEETSVAEEVGRTLGSLRPHSEAPLRKGLGSSRSSTRQAALLGYCQGNIGNAEFFRVVRRALRDPAPNVRWQAITILEQHANLGKADQQRLVALTRDPDARVQAAARGTLQSIAAQVRLKTGRVE